MWFSDGIAESWPFYPVFNILRNRHTISIATAHFTFPPAMHRVPVSPHPS